MLRAEFAIAAIFGILMLTLFGIISAHQASAFDFIPVTFLVKTDAPLPPDSLLAGGYDRVVSGEIDSVQVPGCLDGDQTSYPVQRLVAIQQTGRGMGDVIIISQVEPLPKGTYLQLFTIEQCVDGVQLYNKITAATAPPPSGR